jgi:RNA polymerase-interacting CarD/CdnL/TRCF family regulator
MFKVGDEVTYGVHGRCQITGIETKTIGSKEQDFYAMKPVMAPLVAKTSARAHASILVPVEQAQASGLRQLMTKDEAAMVMTMLADGEYYFERAENWVTKQRRIEECLRREGAKGLAKAVGHLHIVVNSDAAPRSDVTKFYDNLKRALIKEVAEATDAQTKDIEPLVNKALQKKLKADH